MTDHSKWKFNHTMLRVKDPKKSVDYYKLLGLSVVNQIQMPEAKFDLYFLGISVPLRLTSRTQTNPQCLLSLRRTLIGIYRRTLERP